MPISPRPPSGTKTRSEEGSFIDGPSSKGSLDAVHDVEVAGVELPSTLFGVEHHPPALEAAEHPRHLAGRKLHADLRADPMRASRPAYKMRLVRTRCGGEFGEAAREFVRQESEEPFGRSVGGEIREARGLRKIPRSCGDIDADPDDEREGAVPEPMALEQDAGAFRPVDQEIVRPFERKTRM